MKMFERIGTAFVTAVALVVAPQVASATVVSDAANDFLPTFTGTRSGDLDVLSFSATFDGTAFHLGATMNAPIGTLASSLYVIGFNRGAANSNFAAIRLPGVVFDSVITVTGSGVTGGRDLVSSTPITLPAGSFRVNGSHFDLDIPASLLPTRGLAFSEYGINLWPRDSAVAAGVAQISDFAPDSTVLVVPEPQSAALAMLALAAAALGRRAGAARARAASPS